MFNRILKNKEKHLDKYCCIVKQNNLALANRRARISEKFEILYDLCESFDHLSASQRKENLLKYLGLFARRDPIPDECYEFSDEIYTETE